MHRLRKRTPPKPTLFRRLASLLAASLLPVASACDNEAVVPLDTTPSLEALRAELAPGIYPVLTLPGSIEASGSWSGHLRLIVAGVGEQVHSFQGTLSFDPNQVAIKDVAVGDGIAGAHEAAGPGRIRVAAVAPLGIGDDAIIRIRFTGTGPLQPGALLLALDEVIGGPSPGAFQDLAEWVKSEEVLVATHTGGNDG